MTSRQLTTGAALEPKRKRKWQKGFPWLPVVIIGGFIFIAIFAPLLTSHDPYELDLEQLRLPPAFVEGGSPDHILGTDDLGRDLLARIYYGARISLIVAALVLVAGGGAGLVIGLVAGYTVGILRDVIDRLIDTALAFPTILIALLFVVTLGPGLFSLVLAISLVAWARIARVVRGQTLEMKERDFVAQARIVGCSTPRILFVHILPNVVNTFMVLVSLNIGWIIVVEATLSFLGAGIPPPTPTWGRLVADGRAYINTAWWLSVLPGLCITLVVLALNVFGDWFRDVLDPKLRQQM